MIRCYVSTVQTSKTVPAHGDVYAFNDTHELALGVLSLHDAVMDVDNTYKGDLAKELQELFPAMESHVALTTPRVHVKDWTSAWCIEPVMHHAVAPIALPPRRACVPMKKPMRRRQRNRKRTDQEKERENAKRYAERIKFHARREDCLAKERYVREYIGKWIRAYAQVIGVTADASILPLLPEELREIMARSNDTIEAFRGFSGQANLCKVLNEMPTWW